MAKVQKTSGFESRLICKAGFLARTEYRGFEYRAALRDLQCGQSASIINKQVKCVNMHSNRITVASAKLSPPSLP
jgi:hypothetical protein